MTNCPSSTKNPKWVAVGKRNWLKRGPWTPEARERQRQNVLRSRPWEHSTGPKTAKGKAQAAANGKRRQKGSMSVRELRREVAIVAGLLEKMRSVRQQNCEAPEEANCGPIPLITGA